jgi:hypothetical protein
MDPNTGWTVTDTLCALDALKDHRVDYIEQPVKRYDLQGMAAIRRAATGVPVFSWPPSWLATVQPCASVGDSVPATPIAGGTAPSVPPPPWNMKRPFHSVGIGRRTSKRSP